MATDSDLRHRKRRSRPRAVLVAVAAGIAVFLLLVGVQRLGIVGGWPLVVIGVIAVLALPLSRELGRRVLFIGCMAVGFAPLIFWLPFPQVGVTRYGASTALVIAVLTACVVGGTVRARDLVPRLRGTDAVAAAGTVFAAWCVAPLLTVGDGHTALRMMRSGWDYAAHFDMVQMIRRSGSLLSLTAGPPFEGFAYRDYPKGFHAAVAVLMELTLGGDLAAPGEELIGFAQATAVVSVLVVAVLLAGVVSIPSIRRHTLVAVPLVALVTVAFTLGPAGGTLVFAGFPNFLVAVALLACVPVIVICLERVTPIAPALALSAALVGVAHNWALLLVPAVGALVGVLIPARRGRWPRSSREWMSLAGVAAVTLLGVALAWFTLQSAPGGKAVSHLLIDGGFIGGSRSEMLLAPVVAVLGAIALWWRSRHRDRCGSSEAMRTAALGLLPLTGLALLAALAAYQVASVGQLGYYFYKYGAAVQLSSIVLIAVTTGVLVSVERRRRTSRTSLVVAAVGLTCLLLVYSGVVNVVAEGVALRTPAAVESRAAWQRMSDGPTPSEPESSPVELQAAAAVTDAAQHIFVPADLDGSTQPRLTNQWMFALVGQWTDAGYRIVDELWGDSVPVEDRPRTPAEAAVRIHAADPDVVIVVPPHIHDSLRSDPRLSEATITTW